MLEICRELFSELNIRKIEYCSWKGNEHLEDGLNGEKDLDILVKKERYFEINQILYSLKFRKYEPKNYLKYLSIEDFIGLDIASGKLIHIHLHYELRIGRKFIEDYHLPFEEFLYRNRIYHEKYKLFILDPNLEIILLIMRYILQNGKIHGSFSQKLNWYLGEICIEKVFTLAEELLNERFAMLLIDSISRSDNKKNFNKLREEVMAQLINYKTSAKLVSTIKYTKRKFEAASNYFLLKVCHLPFPYRRVNPCGGKVIVFIGVDGSGKSTLVSEINRWLSWKVDVFSIYFGSGNGRCSAIRYPLLKVMKLAKLSRNKPNAKTEPVSRIKNKVKHSSTVYQVARTIWAITLAYEKRSKFKQLWSARSRGLTVLCDRYPQFQTAEINDGPLLSKWLNSKSTIARKIARWESKIYQLANTYHPDVVIKLNISDEISLKRKPEMTISQIQKKKNAIDKILFSENTIMYEIDTSEDLSIALIKIKNIIWL